ncbi:MAG: response regulator transcription factor, partial [Pseudomonadota bacterium]
FASSIEEAISQISALRPSLTLVDLFTANYDFQKLKQLVAHTKPGLVIVIDDRLNPAFASLAKWAGAAGYLTKDVDAEGVKRAITWAIEGGGNFPAELSETSNGQAQPATRGLSARQLEVLAQVALGKSNQEIAEALGISVGTVKTHVHTVLTLIGARNRTHAALIAGRSHGRSKPASAPPSAPPA